MEKLITFLFLAFSFVVSSNGNSLAPAAYFFGDSGMDTGNNNYVKTIANVSRWPSGVDLNNQTGRFCNGKTIADFIAINLGLPMAPAYLSLNELARSKTTTGINYASGSCGILSTTGETGCLTLQKQIEYFTSTLKQDLPKAIKCEEELRRYVSKSIFVLIIGANDMNPMVSRTLVELNEKLNPGSPKLKLGMPIPLIVVEKMGVLLLEQLTQHIKTLYELGARKFLVSDYYGGVALQERVKPFSDAKFTYFETNALTKEVTEHPAKYGFKNIKDPCYNETQHLLCPNRKEYMKWDMAHTTEAANEIAGKDCFNDAYGGHACKPLTLEELAKAP
ncbi:hypothetical protein L6164_026976 [Bauhinia variegata]|uniref:Uncharacterized protein n=1 Tax=Bauhinia variegata TaxID=167791 RepID=A0ACB9LSP0_BAUVA|nr:hypothetical protein L6164_026976 [Bauhinia variegata]